MRTTYFSNLKKTLNKHITNPSVLYYITAGSMFLFGVEYLFSKRQSIDISDLFMPITEIGIGIYLIRTGRRIKQESLEGQVISAETETLS